MLIALTGTPGTGKTTLSMSLKNKYNVIDMNKLIKDNKLYTEVDYERDCLIADPEKIQKCIDRIVRGLDEQSSDTVTLIDGHLSHTIKGLDAVIVLRCHPGVLEARLAQRGYSRAKVQENAESEALDIILSEAVSVMQENTYEIDTTTLTPDSAGEKIEQIVTGLGDVRNNAGLLDKYRPGSINWIDEVEYS